MSPQAPADRRGGGRPREAARLLSHSEWLRIGLFMASILLLAGTFTFTAMMVRRLSDMIPSADELPANRIAA